MNWAALTGLVLSLPAVAVMLFHPVGPAVMILASTPFDAIPFVFFGPAANVLTLLPVLIFLIRTPSGSWMDVFFGTRIQQLMFVLILALFFSHAWSVYQYGYYVIPEYLRKIALFLIVGVVTRSMSTPRNLMSCVRAIAIGMAAFAVFSILEFYFGVHILPMASHWGSEGVIGAVWDENSAEDFRLRGAGDAVSVNRFANWLLLPLFLSMGYFSRKGRSRAERLLAFACLGALSIALLGTISRSALLGLAVGGFVLMVLTFRERPIQAVAIVVLGLLGAGVLALLARLLGFDDLILYRFSSEVLGESGRESRWATALHLFSQDPILGIGIGNYATYAGFVMGDAHNAFLNMLVESGLVGLLPQLILFAYTLYRLAVRPRVSNELTEWRPYFLGAFFALVVSNLFNTYAFERVLWFTVAYAALLERLHRTATVEARWGDAQASVPETPAIPWLEPATVRSAAHRSDA